MKNLQQIIEEIKKSKGPDELSLEAFIVVRLTQVFAGLIGFCIPFALYLFISNLY